MGDTLTIEKANEPLLEEMLRDAKRAPEPGDLTSIIHKGDKEVESPMTLKELTSPGWPFVYDTQTGEQSTVNTNMLPVMLRKKRADGTYIFTTVKPKFSPKRGSLKCLLHPDNPDREHHNELGLATCRKSNLPSPYQVNRHMQKRHPMEWATIEQERIDAEKKKDREFQQRLMKKVAGKTKKK